jgi:hypothetical protein
MFSFLLSGGTLDCCVQPSRHRSVFVDVEEKVQAASQYLDLAPLSADSRRKRDCIRGNPNRGFWDVVLG